MPSTLITSDRKEVAVAGTAERLVAVPTPCNEVIITAETNNTGVIVFGGSNVVAAVATRIGIPLAAGASAVITIDDAFDLWLDTTVNTDGVTYAVLGGT